MLKGGIDSAATVRRRIPGSGWSFDRDFDWRACYLVFRGGRTAGLSTWSLLDCQVHGWYLMHRFGDGDEGRVGSVGKAPPFSLRSNHKKMLGSHDDQSCLELNTAPVDRSI